MPEAVCCRTPERAPQRHPSTSQSQKLRSPFGIGHSPPVSVGGPAIEPPTLKLSRLFELLHLHPKLLQTRRAPSSAQSKEGRRPEAVCCRTPGSAPRRQLPTS